MLVFVALKCWGFLIFLFIIKALSLLSTSKKPLTYKRDLSSFAWPLWNVIKVRITFYKTSPIRTQEGQLQVSVLRNVQPPYTYSKINCNADMTDRPATKKETQTQYSSVSDWKYSSVLNLERSPQTCDWQRWFLLIPQKKTRFRCQRIHPLHKERVDQSAFDCKVPAHNMTLWMNKYICEAKKKSRRTKKMIVYITPTLLNGVRSL